MCDRCLAKALLDPGVQLMETLVIDTVQVRGAAAGEVLGNAAVLALAQTAGCSVEVALERVARLVRRTVAEDGREPAMIQLPDRPA